MSRCKLPVTEQPWAVKPGMRNRLRNCVWRQVGPRLTRGALLQLCNCLITVLHT